MSLTEFYDATPREVVAVINANAWRKDHEYRVGLNLAWHIAMFQRGQELPELAAIMPPSFDEQRALRRGDSSVDYRGRPKPTPHQEWDIWMAIATQANAIHAQRVAAGLEPASPEQQQDS